MARGKQACQLRERGQREGFLEDLLNTKLVEQISQLWHTSFTSLYSVEFQEGSALYPGGILRENIDKIVFKIKYK